MELFPKRSEMTSPATPLTPAEPAWRSEPASPGQLGKIGMLRRERDDTGMGAIPEGITKGKASDAIEWLERRPIRPLPPTGYFQLADGTIFELRRTQDQKRVYALLWEDGRFNYAPTESAAGIASIGTKVDDPRTAARAQTPAMDSGFYEVDGQVYRVVESQAGRLYVLMLDMDNLRPNEKMTWLSNKITLAGLARLPFKEIGIDTVRDLGAITDHCVYCNRVLSHDNSTKAGYGPGCAKKYGLPWG